MLHWFKNETWCISHYTCTRSYSISQEICIRFCCALLCCGYAIVHNSFTWSFIHIHQGCCAGTEAIVRLPQCQWSKPDGYGKISQCITTTKHSKAKTVCIFLGIYCMLLRYCYGEINRSYWSIDVIHFHINQLFVKGTDMIVSLILCQWTYNEYRQHRENQRKSQESTLFVVSVMGDELYLDTSLRWVSMLNVVINAANKVRSINIHCCVYYLNWGYTVGI